MRASVFKQTVLRVILWLAAFFAAAAIWVRYLLLVMLVALGAASCGPMLYGGGGPPPKPAHFQIVLHNDDPGYHPGDPQIMFVTNWDDNGIITTTVAVSVPALGRVTVDLGTVHPYGIQVVGNGRWGGIPAVVGGVVYSGPEISDCWVFNLEYPSGTTWKGP